MVPILSQMVTTILFNFFFVKINKKKYSTLARAGLDIARTFCVWMFSIFIAKWEEFN